MDTRSVLIFVAGGSIGSLVTYILMNKKKSDELEIMREFYSKKRSKPEEPTDIPEEKVENMVNHAVAEKDTYTNYAAAYTTKEEDTRTMDIHEKKILAIDQFTFDDDEECNKVILTLYSDGVLADDLDNVIKNRDELVGQKNIDELANSDILDEVFVRNLILNTDYQIVKGTGTYEEVTGISPDI